MKNEVQQLLSAVIALAAWLPLPAAAEMHGIATCASPSWNAVVSGECGIGDVNIVGQPRQGDSDSSTALIVVINDPIPEPETYALMLVGLIAVIAAARRRRRD